MTRRATEEGTVKTDADLQRAVTEEIEWDPSIDASQIGVAAHDGIVTLTGCVHIFAEKHAAEERAKHIRGVRAIANEIEVRPPESHHRDDADIAAAAIHALDWHAKVPHEGIQVIVDQGWITLEGSVDWRYQKESIENVVRHLNGVHGVTNKIAISPGVTESATVENVEAALRRSARLRTRNISIETESGLVTLTGDVHCLAERDEAERMAWAAGGVQCVENCITITPWGDGPAEEWGY